jgi:hypothetical protein
LLGCRNNGFERNEIAGRPFSKGLNRRNLCHPRGFAGEDDLGVNLRAVAKKRDAARAAPLTSISV